jgi:hypothetical protein
MNLRDLDWSRIGKITLFFFATIIFGLLLYVFFFKSAAPPSTPKDSANVTPGDGLLLSNQGLVIPTENGNVSIGLPPTQNTNAVPYISENAKGGVTRVSTLIDNAVKGLMLAGNGVDAMYYNTADKRFYRISPNGKPSMLIDKRFYDIDNVAFSRSKDKAVIEYPDGANVAYNFTTGAQITLPQHWEEFTFSKRTESLAFKSLGINPENNFLAIGNADGSGSKIIEELGENEQKVKIDWSPDDVVVALYTDPLSDQTSGEQQEVVFLGKNEENFKSMLVEGYNFENKWSKTGDRLMYSVHSSRSDFKPEIWIANSQGNAIGSGRRNLRLETWAHKCDFENNGVVYCGVPDSIAEGVGFYPELNNHIPDKIYRIDLKTGAKTLVAIPDGNYTVQQMNVSEDGKYLYFMDVNTGKLHKINL